MFFLGRVGEIFPLSVFSRRAADDQPLLPPARSELAVASFFELALSRRIAIALSLLPLETLAVPRDGAGIDFPHHPRSERGGTRGARIEIRPRRNSSAPLTRRERERCDKAKSEETGSGSHHSINFHAPSLPSFLSSPSIAGSLTPKGSNSKQLTDLRMALIRNVLCTKSSLGGR